MQISSITKRPHTCVRSAYSFSRVCNENILKVCGKFEHVKISRTETFKVLMSLNDSVYFASHIPSREAGTSQ